MTVATADPLKELEELGPELEIRAGRMPDVQFTQVPNWVFLADGIKPQAQALYVHLVMHLNRERGDSQVWPSQEALASRLGLSRVQSLTPYFKQLEELGALDMQITRYQGGMRQRYVYTVHLVPPDGYTGPLDQDQWYKAFKAAKSVRNSAQATAKTPADTSAPTADTPPHDDPATAPTTDTTETPTTGKTPRKRAKSPEEQAVEDKATKGAEWWWGERKTKANQNPKPGRLAELVALKKIAPYVGNKGSAYHATRTLILNALKAGYDSGTIATALENGGRAFPSRQQFEDACARAAGVDIDRTRKGGARAPYDDDATWGALKQQKASTPTPTAPKPPADDDEFGLRDLADSA
jgi:hypothetical protein